MKTPLPWRTSPVLFAAGVLVMTPLIVIGSLLALLVFAASELVHGAQQANARHAAAPNDPAPLAPVVELPSAALTDQPVSQAA